MTVILAAAIAAGTLSASAQSALEEMMRRRAAELGGSAPAATDSTAPAGDVSATAAAPTSAATTTTFTAPDQSVDPANMAEAVVSTGLSTNGILMNFNNAPVSVVLKYMSSAAGFHIVVEGNPRGYVTVISGHPMTKDEAVELLNSVLSKNNLAIIRKGNLLKIVDKSDAGRGNLPVSTWTNGNPESIPDNEEIVTKILPIKFVEARQLVTDLSSFVNPQAITVNESANSIIITDTQSNIRHYAELIKAIDSSAEGETVIKVFTLKYAFPSDVATTLSGIFPSNTGGGRGGGAANAFATLFAGGGRGGGRGGAAGGGSSSRISKQTQVIAVADNRTRSVVVTAEKNMMDQIEATIKELDVSSKYDQDVHVVDVPNGADPTELLTILQQTFPTSANANRSTTTSAADSAIKQRATKSAQSQSVGSTSSSSIGSTSSTRRSGP